MESHCHLEAGDKCDQRWPLFRRLWGNRPQWQLQGWKRMQKKSCVPAVEDMSAVGALEIPKALPCFRPGVGPSADQWVRKLHGENCNHHTTHNESEGSEEQRGRGADILPKASPRRTITTETVQGAMWLCGFLQITKVLWESGQVGTTRSDFPKASLCHYWPIGLSHEAGWAMCSISSHWPVIGLNWARVHG